MFVYLILGYIMADLNIKILSILIHYFKMGHKSAEADRTDRWFKAYHQVHQGYQKVPSAIV